MTFLLSASVSWAANLLSSFTEDPSVDQGALFPYQNQRQGGSGLEGSPDAGNQPPGSDQGYGSAYPSESEGEGYDAQADLSPSDSLDLSGQMPNPYQQFQQDYQLYQQYLQGQQSFGGQLPQGIGQTLPQQGQQYPVGQAQSGLPGTGQFGSQGQFLGSNGSRNYFQPSQLPMDQEDFLPMPYLDDDYQPRGPLSLSKEKKDATQATPVQAPQQKTPDTAKEKPAAGDLKALKKLTRRDPLRGLSSIERTLSETPVTAEKAKSQPYGTGALTQFGYSFFRQEYPKFSPLTDIPVGPDYRVNVGDRLVLTVWGSFDGVYNIEVNRAGEITLPRVGAVKVAGERFDQLPILLRAAIGKVYKNFNLNVNMGRLRSIKVYVVGEVQRPGDYNVNSLSTVLSALVLAGGPTKSGSLRSIQINRGGEVVETVDLYQFFLKGDKGKDIRLQPGDTVLVPVIGPVAGVAGNVRRPAIYELKGERTLKELLDLAGGINPSGYLQRVQVYRVQAHDKKMVTDINLDLNGNRDIDQQAGSFAVQDHDVVQVLPIDGVLHGYVRLSGHVLRPGDVALKPGMRVSALLSKDNLLPEYYGQAGQIIRLCPPDQHPEVIFFDLSKALAQDPGNDLELKEFDRVRVFSRKEMEELPFVRINGEVQRPGQKRYFQNMTVRDLLMAGGNVKMDAYLKNAEVTRLKRSGDSVSSYSIQVDLEKALAGGAENIKLQPFDELSVRRIPNWSESTERYVLLKGEFRFPGVYPIFKGERLSSVIERAGGFTDLAYLKGAKFTREIARRLQQQRMDEALSKAQEDIIKLQTKITQTAASPEEVASTKTTLETLMQSVEVLKTKRAEGRVLIEIASLEDLKGSVYDVELQGGDRLTVPSDPGTVNVIGDVYNQNSIVSQREKSVEWYLDQVGGATGDADLSEVYVVKVNGSVISRKNSGHFLFFNSFWRKHLDSGDTVIVPRQYEKTAWLRDIKDIAQVLGNIAVTAGVLVAAGLKF
ncbi:SLBB domain-containing protein [Geomonas limicola]|uniref:SLBB domain-containing protein n=1 Tax=Geomonas limicola TaxID=2740186 RepID=UPI001FE8C820|nr:SLBB domain-containing protein [Geomonas limicola]